MAALTQLRQQFEAEVAKLYQNRKNKQQWSKERIESVKNTLAYMGQNRTVPDGTSCKYYYQSKYATVTSEGKTKLVFRGDKESPWQSFEIIPSEEYFDILWKFHSESGHCGRDRLFAIVKKNECYIPSPVQCILIRICPTCNQKPQRSKKKLTTQTAFVDIPEFNATSPSDTVSALPVDNTPRKRGFVDILDMTSTPDGEFNHIMYYQDLNNRYSLLRPLATSNVGTIADELMKIFFDFGFPTLLHTSYRPFTAELLKSLNAMMSEKILNGKRITPHGYHKDGVQRLVQDWMKDSGSRVWRRGINIIQLNMNCLFSTELGMSPFKAMFGRDATVGLRASDTTRNISREEILCLNDEEELDEFCKQRRVNLTGMVIEPTKTKTVTSPLAGLQSHYEFHQLPLDFSSQKLEAAVPLTLVHSEDGAEWCWVCGENEDLGSTCSECHENIHEHCGTFVDNSVVCNMCLEEKLPVDKDGEDIMIEVKQEEIYV